MKLLNSLLSGAAMAFALSLASPAAAQDCPRGDLDKRFCDVDGDLIADTPTDPADQVDPDTLVFAGCDAPMQRKKVLHVHGAK